MQSVRSIIRECPIDAVCFTAILTLALMEPTRIAVVSLALSALCMSHTLYTRAKQAADDEVVQ